MVLLALEVSQRGHYATSGEVANRGASGFISGVAITSGTGTLNTIGLPAAANVVGNQVGYELESTIDKKTPLSRPDPVVNFVSGAVGNKVGGIAGNRFMGTSIQRSTAILITQTDEPLPTIQGC